MALRSIATFFQDEEGHWVAQLDCSHTLHMRHRPPQEYREWVLSEAGREQRIGAQVDCQFCNMPALPPDVRSYKRTADFSQDTVPRGLLRDHSTAPGVWGRIVVESGRLLYEIPEMSESWVLRPGVVGVVAPTQKHHVRIIEPVQFFVEFLR